MQLLQSRFAAKSLGRGASNGRAGTSRPRYVAPRATGGKWAETGPAGLRPTREPQGQTHTGCALSTTTELPQSAWAERGRPGRVQGVLAIGKETAKGAEREASAIRGGEAARSTELARGRSSIVLLRGAEAVRRHPLGKQGDCRLQTVECKSGGGRGAGTCLQRRRSPPGGCRAPGSEPSFLRQHGSGVGRVDARSESAVRC